MRRTLVLVVSAVLAPPVGALSAQQAPAGQNLSRPSVFFDCEGPRCNEREYFRTEIDWVNWVNVRENADVHVIMTSQTTGGCFRRRIRSGLPIQLDMPRSAPTAKAIAVS